MLPVDVFKVLNAIGEQKTVSSLPSVFQEHSHCPRSFWTSYAVFCSGIPQDKKPGLLIYAASHYVCWMAVALHFQMTLGLTQTASCTEALGGGCSPSCPHFLALATDLLPLSLSHVTLLQSWPDQWPSPRNLKIERGQEIWETCVSMCGWTGKMKIHSIHSLYHVDWRIKKTSFYFPLAFFVVRQHSRAEWDMST